MSPLEKLTFIATVRIKNRDRNHLTKLANLMKKIKAEIEKRKVQLNTSMDALVAVAELWEELQPTQDVDVSMLVSFISKMKMHVALCDSLAPPARVLPTPGFCLTSSPTSFQTPVLPILLSNRPSPPA